MRFEANSIFDELCAWRRQLHACPEPSGAEYRSAELVEQTLASFGIQTTRPTPTAVVGTLQGDGKTVALRADMDALPIREQTGLPFSSQKDGWMHACGHDLHTAALLGAAKLLAACQSELHGTVKFFFEPDEEGRGGARPMIAGGCMEHPTVDAVFGCHVDPTLPVGTVGLREGTFYAASNPFTVTVHGKSAHAAAPDLGADALAAAADMIRALRRNEPDIVLSVCMMQAGKAENIIADQAVFSGVLRTLGKETRAKMLAALQNTVKEIALSYNVTAEIDITDGYSGVINDPESTRFVRRTATELFGADRVVTIEHPTMTTEDFGYFLDKTSGCYYHIGVGHAGALHSAGFVPDERALPVMAALHAALAFQFLNS